MPDFLLTLPEGERFKIGIPEGVSDEEVNSISKIIPSGSESPASETRTEDDQETQGQVAQEAREVAAQRTKRAVSPIDHPPMEVPAHLQSWGNYASHAGQQLKEAATDVVAHPENLVGTGELGGIVRSGSRVATGGLRPFQTQQLLVQHNRDLAAGRITEEQFRARREALGLPAETPSYLRPVSDTQQPRGTPPQPTPEQDTLRQMYAEMPRLQREAPQPRQGVLGGDTSARQLFQDHIAPHIDEQQFATNYFGGMYSPWIKLKKTSETSTGGLDFEGVLKSEGQSIGTIHRRIYPDRGVAVHDFLELYDDHQASGIAKSLIRNQIDTYRQIGVNRVELIAGLQVGGYAWAKYGFLPEDGEAWKELQSDIRSRMRYLKMDKESQQAVNATIEKLGPYAVWSLADMKQPARRTISNDDVPLGKALLLGQTWRGLLHLDSPTQMKRFDDYVGGKTQPSQFVRPTPSNEVFSMGQPTVERNTVEEGRIDPAAGMANIESDAKTREQKHEESMAALRRRWGIE